MRKRLLDALDENIALCKEYIDDIDGQKPGDEGIQTSQMLQDYFIAKILLKEYEKLASNVIRKGYKF